MNYLAHAYLSFGDPDILAGNMISDFVKGKQKFDYPERIQMGITFTGKLMSTRIPILPPGQAKQFLKESAGLYAGSFVDIVYDHFLANDPYEFEEGALAIFHPKNLPAAGITKNGSRKNPGVLLLYAGQNWLYHYRTTEGIHNSFSGLCRRAKYIDNPEPVFEAFLTHYDALKMAYEFFFPHVKAFAYHELIYLRGS